MVKLFEITMRLYWSLVKLTGVAKINELELESANLHKGLEDSKKLFYEPHHLNCRAALEFAEKMKPISLCRTY